MAIKKIICKDCGKEFTYNKKNKYIRKYCDSCSKKRKKDYENLYLIKAEDCEED
ncbi:MAG: hypothetical protein QXW97_01265 [Candidatus Pacearchaeota archaeon]